MDNKQQPSSRKPTIECRAPGHTPGHSSRIPSGFTFDFLRVQRDHATLRTLGVR